MIVNLVVGIVLLAVATYLYIKGEKQDAIYFAVLATANFAIASAWGVA